MPANDELLPFACSALSEVQFYCDSVRSSVPRFRFLLFSSFSSATPISINLNSYNNTCQTNNSKILSARKPTIAVLCSSRARESRSLPSSLLFLSAWTSLRWRSNCSCISISWICWFARSISPQQPALLDSLVTSSLALCCCCCWSCDTARLFSSSSGFVLLLPPGQLCFDPDFQKSIASFLYLLTFQPNKSKNQNLTRLGFPTASISGANLDVFLEHGTGRKPGRLGNTGLSLVAGTLVQDVQKEALVRQQAASLSRTFTRVLRSTCRHHIRAWFCAATSLQKEKKRDKEKLLEHHAILLITESFVRLIVGLKQYDTSFTKSLFLYKCFAIKHIVTRKRTDVRSCPVLIYSNQPSWMVRASDSCSKTLAALCAIDRWMSASPSPSNP